MTMFTVDDACVKCGLCAELCVRDIIQFSKQDKPFVPPKMESECIQCGQCVAFCPKSCCHLAFQPAGDRVAIDASLIPDTISAETFLRSRRSIRKFSNKLVDEATIHRIFETARYSPTASNSQIVRWTVTKNKERTREIGAMVVDTLRENVKTIHNPADKAKQQACVDKWDNGEDSIFRGAPQVAIALIDKDYGFPDDAAIALTYFELAAHANNVGCCWAGLFTRACRANPHLRKAVGAVDQEIVVGGQMFGYPNGLRYARLLPPRKKPNITYI